VTFAQDTQNFDRIERGRYLSVLGDCAACHTAPGSQPFAGGLALQTPFGKLVAPNITPDRETGIGNMTDDEFVAALRDGRGHNGARLYPAMPYPAYTKMTDDDVLAMRAYFATVAPASNRVISNQLPFPFNIRLSMAFWNALNFTPGRYQSNPQKSAEWNRGAYIVEGAAHCGTCHTPKTVLGGEERSGVRGRDIAGLVRAQHYNRFPQGCRRLVEGRPGPVPQGRYQQLDAGLRANGRGCYSLEVANDGRGYFRDCDLSERWWRGRLCT
jgi:mono/diheme cytochrome c family protein